MLRSSIVTLVIASIAMGSNRAGAQNSVSVAGGIAVPVGSAADALNTGYNASFALTAKPPLASVGIRLEGMFNSFGFKDNSVGANTQRILAGIANATLSDASTPLRSFYLIAGIGAYNTKVIGGPPTDPNNDIGFNVGIGITLTTGVGTFLEARYHHVPSEVSTLRLVPVTFGLKF
ncbi:MAG: hypothetical protein ACREXY_02250 [Gammaproteobacteria bacterium]